MNPERTRRQWEQATLLRNVQHLSDMADRRGLIVHSQPVGVHELTIDTQALERGLAAQAASAQDTSLAVQDLDITMSRVVDGLSTIEVSLGELCDLEAQSLTMLGAGVMLQRAQLAATAVLVETVEREGEVTREVIRVTSLESTRRVLEGLRVSTEVSVATMLDVARRSEEQAERRHGESLDVQRDTLRHQADSRYRNALTQWRTKHLSACVEDLEETFQLFSTHARGWILYGRCCWDCGLPAYAKAAYRKAAAYALDQGQDETYVEAIITLSASEMDVGNLDLASDVVEEARDRLGEGIAPFLLAHLQLHSHKLRLHGREEPERGERMIRGLYWLVEECPAIVDAVASDPFWSEACKRDRFFTLGRALYLSLAMRCRQEGLSEEAPLIAVLIDCDAGKNAGSLPDLVRTYLQASNDQ